MTVKNDIISKASDELEIVDRQIIQLPEIIGEVQLNLDDLIVPASNFDRRVCELTQAVNLKVKELEVLNDLITGGCITLIGEVTVVSNHQVKLFSSMLFRVVEMIQRILITLVIILFQQLSLVLLQI